VLMVVVSILVLVRLFVYGIYEVDSRSMAPTLRSSSGEGESVLVRYGRGTLERFDLVVLRLPGVKEPRVKRIVGLPGESVQVVLGDLLIDGERLPLSAPRPPLVEIFSEERDEVSEWFTMGGTEVNPWVKTEEGWHLAAEEVPSGAAAGSMFFAKRLTARHISGDPEAETGGASAADAVVGCEVRPGDPPAELHFELSEQGDTFRAEMDPGVGGEWAGRLLQTWRGGEELLLAEGTLSLEPGGWNSVRFGNVDDALFFEVTPQGGSTKRLTADSTENHFHPEDRLSQGKTFGHRVSFGGAAGQADFQNIRVWRDFHYTDRGIHSIGEPVRLGPNELFVLGDNSPDSRDGRDWGPISTADILGRPVWVVWPMSAARALGEGLRPLICSDNP